MLLVGAPGKTSSKDDRGKLLAIDLKTRKLLWVLDGADPGFELGASLSVDCSKTLQDDQIVFVGAPRVAASAGDQSAGRVFMVMLATGAVSRKYQGREGDVRFGASVLALGDIDGDGASDLAVGAPGGGAMRRGVVTIVSGGTGNVVGQLVDPGDPWDSDQFGTSLGFVRKAGPSGELLIAIGFSDKSMGFNSFAGSCSIFNVGRGAMINELKWGAEPNDYMSRFGWVVTTVDAQAEAGASEILVGAPDFGMCPGGVAIAKWKRGSAEGTQYTIDYVWPDDTWLSVLKK